MNREIGLQINHKAGDIYTFQLDVATHNENAQSAAKPQIPHEIQDRKAIMGKIEKAFEQDNVTVDSLEKLGKVMYNQFLPNEVKKVLRQTEDNKPLLIALDDPTIPWELIHDGTDFLMCKYSVGRLLLTEEPLQLPSVHQREQAMQFLLIADPTGGENAENSLPPLPETSEEVKFLRDALNNQIGHMLLNNEGADLFAIQTQFVEEWDVIHYAGHVVYDKVKGGFIPLPEKMSLHPKNIPTLRGMPLVFLNGCDANKRKVRQSTASLAESFLLRGARGVIGTLYRIKDGCAKEFALSFYNRLLRGEAIGDALRMTRLEMRKRFPDDSTYLSFILYGYPTMRVTKPVPPLPWRNDGFIDEAKFSPDARAFLQSLQEEMKQKGSESILPIHFLSAFLQTARGKQTMANMKKRQRL